MLIPSLLVFLPKWPVLSVCQCVSVSVSYSPSWDWRPSSTFIKYHGCPKLVLFGILFLFCTFFLGYLYTSFEWSWLYIDISRNFCETHPVYQLSAWYSFFYILKASPVPTILDHSDLSSCLWVLLGFFPTGPQFTTFLLPGVYEVCLFSLFLLLPAHSMLSITLLSLDNCSSYLTDLLFAALTTLSSKDKKKKKPVYALSLPLLSDAVLNVDYKVWSFFPGVGHWQVTAFFCSLFLPVPAVGMVLAPCYMGLCSVPFSSSSSFITYSCPVFLISGQVSFLQDINPVTMEMA